MNADESVVLYDLVRSGEASRLRRRGAVHVRSTSNSGAIRVDTEGIGGADVSGGYTLLCGVEYEDLEAPLGDEGKYELQVLPWTSSSVSAGKQKAVEMRSNLRSTGCGSVIHGHASPRPRLGVWIASRGTSMDEGIVIPTMPEEVTRSACGCVRERVGCAICGNILGTRFKPCSSTPSRFHPDQQDGGDTEPQTPTTPKPSSSMPRQPLRGPSGPAYWAAYAYTKQGSSSSQKPTGALPVHDGYSYTFLASAVTATPDHQLNHIETQHVNPLDAGAHQASHAHAGTGSSWYDNVAMELRDIYLNTEIGNNISTLTPPIARRPSDTRPLASGTARRTTTRRPSSFRTLPRGTARRSAPPPVLEQSLTVSPLPLPSSELHPAEITQSDPLESEEDNGLAMDLAMARAMLVRTRNAVEEQIENRRAHLEANQAVINSLGLRIRDAEASSSATAVVSPRDPERRPTRRNATGTIEVAADEPHASEELVARHTARRSRGGRPLSTSRTLASLYPPGMPIPLGASPTQDPELTPRASTTPLRRANTTPFIPNMPQPPPPGVRSSIEPRAETARYSWGHSLRRYDDAPLLPRGTAEDPQSQTTYLELARAQRATRALVEAESNDGDRRGEHVPADPVHLTRVMERATRETVETINQLLAAHEDLMRNYSAPQTPTLRNDESLSEPLTTVSETRMASANSESASESVSEEVGQETLTSLPLVEIDMETDTIPADPAVAHTDATLSVDQPIQRSNDEDPQVDVHPVEMQDVETLP